MSLEEHHDPHDNALIVLQTLQKEVTSLQDTFNGLLEALKNVSQGLPTTTLEHVLVMDSAAEATQVLSSLLLCTLPTYTG